MFIDRRSLLAGLLALGAAPGAALAGHGASAPLEIDNRFAGEAEVWLDGRFEALVPGGARAVLDARPGQRDVVVRRPGTGYVLAATRVHLHREVRVVLPVHAPPGALRVENQGEVPLKLTLGDAATWISPGTGVELPVLTGPVRLTASIREPRGEWLALERELWVEPGQVASTVLRPDPTVVRVVNQDAIPVRVLLDGIDAGVVGPGQTQRVFVRPGPTRVVLVDLSGRVRTETRIDAPRGETAEVVLHGVRPAVIGGPMRPGWAFHASFR